MKRFLSIALVGILCFLVACSQSQVVTSLQVAVDAAEVAFPIVASQANLSPAVTAQVTGYLQGVNGAVSQAAPILASTDPPAAKVAEISAIFAKIAAPQLPPGTPQAVVNAVADVARAVAQFLANIQTPAPKSLKPGQVAKATTPSKNDLAQLMKIELKAKANLVKMKKK